MRRGKAQRREARISKAGNCQRKLLPILTATGIAITAPSYGSETGIWARDKATGRWGSLRTELVDQGITLNASETAEVLSNTSGGQKTGTVFTGRAVFDLDLDLDKLGSWRGATIHISALQIHGHGLMADKLGGNLFAPSNIDANHTTRLFSAYLEQSLANDTLSIRIGQLAADDEFLAYSNAGARMNGTFGWAGIVASNLPSGGPAYPLASPGLRIKWTPEKSFYWQTAIFNGDPAGHCSDNPQTCNADGLTFATNNDALLISEASYTTEQDLHTTIKLGGWYHTGSFSDLRYDANGDLAAVTTNDHARHHSNFGIYAVLGQMIWREGEAQGLDGFIRIGAAPGDRSLVPFYFDTGLSYTGLIEGRDNDIFGIGFAFAKISDRASAYDHDYNDAHPLAMRPVRDHEAVFELSYSYIAAPWWTIQPDIQYIIHPAGHHAAPDADSDRPASAMKNSVVIGLRTAIQL